MKYTFMYSAWSILIFAAFYESKYKAALYLIVIAVLHALWVIAEHTDPKNRK